ncbi:MAG: Mut7-C RNAse domain-containing protein [Ignisphaera sp.]|uniref:Mut7-C RNAse domain-containing protein n=1 Tax=Ignisphaera aggregans TaxID=334771 RepID=A0A7C4JKV1_9CREN
MPSYPKFIADAMLGHVVRWLRLLGYDTTYYRIIEDWKLIRIAKEEDRILLTRDLGLYRRARKQNIKALFIEDPDVVKVLAILSLKYSIRLDFDKNDSRCTQCNSLLRYTTSLIDISHKVSKDIALKYNEFWICPSCGKVYWQGNHWKTIFEVLEKAKAEKLKTLSKVKPSEKKIEWLSLSVYEQK